MVVMDPKAPPSTVLLFYLWFVKFYPFLDQPTCTLELDLMIELVEEIKCLLVWVVSVSCKRVFQQFRLASNIGNDMET